MYLCQPIHHLQVLILLTIHKILMFKDLNQKRQKVLWPRKEVNKYNNLKNNNLKSHGKSVIF
jgi:hypothetical protein